MLLALLACSPSTSVALDGTKTTPGGAPTWHADVAPILAEHCGGCHVSEGIGPFSFEDYADTAPMANLIVSSVESGAMPPWGAVSTDTCEPRFGWQDDPRLSAEELATLRAWADASAPEGDAASAADIPAAPSMELQDPDVVLTAPAAYPVGGMDDQYVCFSLDPQAPSLGLLTGVQVVPGDAEVVHHVLLYTDPNAEGEALGGDDGAWPCFGGAGVSDAQLVDVWVPGALPFEVSEDAPLPVAAGSRLVMQIHYHPAGRNTEDLTAVHLRWSDGGWPDAVSLLALLGNAWSAETGLWDDPDDRYGFPEFRIPANSESHTEQMSVSLDGLPNLDVFAVGTHMHYLGADMQIDLVHADPQGDEPEEECLVQTPAWDFAWQRIYSYDAPIGEGVKVRDGDDLRLRCTYNNTLGNRGVEQALEDADLAEPIDVYLGEETLDEMCLGMFGVVYTL